MMIHIDVEAPDFERMSAGRMPASQSSRGLEHSKTPRVFEHCGAARNVWECGSPRPLFPAVA
jgi:hypothetical protein